MEWQGTPYVPGIARGRVRFGGANGEAGCVRVLGPAELAAVRADRLPAAVVAVAGAPLSHPMIRLFGLGVPTVILAPEQAAALPPGQALAVDGAAGRITLPECLPEGAQTEPAPLQAGQAIPMADGTPVALRASVAGASGAAWARARGAEAIGLVRSEYLHPRGSRAPDCAYYRHALGAIAEAAAPLPVTVRLLDLAPDKAPPWLGNPAGFAGALGRHGSRLYTVEAVYGAMRAEAAAIGALAQWQAMGVIVPYLTEVAEFRRWRQELADVLPADVAVGAMLETPAAVQEAAAFLGEADFAAIGCNDLMQTFFAADRDTPEVAALLNPYAPALFRFLAGAAAAGDATVDRLTLCGLLPQMPGLLPVLLGLGFRRFSVEPALLPHLARQVAATEPGAAGRLAAAVTAAREPAQVQEALGLPPGAPWGQ